MAYSNSKSRMTKERRKTGQLTSRITARCTKDRRRERLTLPLSHLVRRNVYKRSYSSVRDCNMDHRLTLCCRRDLYGFGRRTSQWTKGVYDWKVKDKRKHDARNQTGTGALGRQTKVEALRGYTSPAASRLIWQNVLPRIRCICLTRHNAR